MCRKHFTVATTAAKDGNYRAPIMACKYIVLEFRDRFYVIYALLIYIDVFIFLPSLDRRFSYSVESVAVFLVYNNDTHIILRSRYKSYGQMLQAGIYSEGEKLWRL